MSSNFGAGTGVFAIDEGDLLMLKLDNGDVVKLECPEYTTTCAGCGSKGFLGSSAQGINVFYPLYKEDVEMILASRVDKVRVHTSDGYLDDTVKDDGAKKLQKALRLLLDYK